MDGVAAKIILLWGWRRTLASLVFGGLLAFAQAPYDFFPVAFLSLTGLVWLLDGAMAAPGAGLLGRLRPAFATGWWFGFGYFLVGLWWIGKALLVDAEAYAWALPFAVIGLPALLAIFYGVAAALARMAWSDGVGRIAALAAAFGIAEYLRSTVLTGFPWNAIGYAAMPTPLLMQSVGIVGLFGMNALAVFVFAAPAMLASGGRGKRAGFAAAILLAILHVAYGAWSIGLPDEEGGRSLAVRLVQPSIDQSGKWDPGQRAAIMQRLLDLSARRPDAAGSAKPRLIVWPETALPYLVTDRPEALGAMGELLDDDQMLLFGAVRAEGTGADARYTNAVVAVDGRGEIRDAVDKRYLVPGGEFLPMQWLFDRIGLKAVAQNVGGFSAGTSRHAIEVGDGVRLLPMICYEIIFSGREPAEIAASDVILNVTNDAWFGDTAGPYQHFRQAQVRAVEWNRPLIRAANNGISAVVDRRGRVLDALAVDAVGVLDIEIAVPASAPGGAGNPLRNAFFVVFLFATVACGANVSLKLRST